MSEHYAVVEMVENGKSQSLRFFPPTRWKWQATLKVLAYRARHAFRSCTIQSRIVDKERAEYLLVSYTEWALRQQIAAAPAT